MLRGAFASVPVLPRDQRVSVWLRTPESDHTKIRKCCEALGKSFCEYGPQFAGLHAEATDLGVWLRPSGEVDEGIHSVGAENLHTDDAEKRRVHGI